MVMWLRSLLTKAKMLDQAVIGLILLRVLVHDRKSKPGLARNVAKKLLMRGANLLLDRCGKQDCHCRKYFAGHALLELAHDLRYSDIDGLYSAVGDGHVSAASIIDKLVASMGAEDSHPEPTMDVLPNRAPTTRRSSNAVDVEGTDDVLVKLARCCTPVPGDPIMGFITKGSGVSIHRSDCTNASDLQSHQADRVVKVKWRTGAASIFLVNIQVEALDRASLLADVTRTLSEQHVNILSAAVSTSKDRTAFSRFTFEMADATHLDAVLAAVRGIEGVYDVYRTTNN
jgi:GTP diphosphokinase / guanosine-3',5'-bis(diphosphate) 3'-diphosphatase